MKQARYNIDNISSKNANFNLIYGMKSNGKSYQVKHKKAIIEYLESVKIDKSNPHRFILMRRWSEDMSMLWIEQYFADVDVTTLTDGKYNCITCWRKTLYLSIIKDDGKVLRGEKIGYTTSLSGEQHLSGASFLDVYNIIFEEFMERGCYLAQEVMKLEAFYNTVDRKRGVVKMWLVGNTISRVCPYIEKWGLTDIFRKQKQGDIDVVEIAREENTFYLALEFCKMVGGKSMAISSAGSMIDNGDWMADPQPHLPKSKKEYNIEFRFVFQYKNFRFLCELLTDKKDRKNYCWFIYPKYSDIKNKTLVISDVVKNDIFYQGDLYNLTIKNKKLHDLFYNFRESNIFYSDDLTGTDFKHAINFSIKK